jgi:hypothetical protein
MDQNAWITLFVGIALASAVFALGVVLYPKLKNERQGYPFEAEIEAALLPLIFQGVCAAYRLSEKGIDEVHERWHNADKKKIADSIYGLLPAKIGDFDLSLVKRIVSRDRFEELVQDAFDRFDKFYIQHQARFDELFEMWKTGQTSVPNPPSSSSGRPVPALVPDGVVKRPAFSN